DEIRKRRHSVIGSEYFVVALRSVNSRVPAKELLLDTNHRDRHRACWGGSAPARYLRMSDLKQRENIRIEQVSGHRKSGSASSFRRLSSMICRTSSNI